MTKTTTAALCAGGCGTMMRTQASSAPAGKRMCHPCRRLNPRPKTRSGNPGGRKPDTPCSVCGVLLWGGSTSLPAGERTCRPCRRARNPKPVAWVGPVICPCTDCKILFVKSSRRRQLCPGCQTSRRRKRQASKRQTWTGRPNPRSGRPRERAKAEVRSKNEPCHLCGFDIDLTRDRVKDPLGSTIDELVPISRGGSATDPSNLAHAHRICNTSRGSKDITPAVITRCRSLVRGLL